MDYAVPQSIGYGIVVGVGFAFAIGMTFVAYGLQRYQRERFDAEEFATAGRTVQSGLIAVGVLSSTTWAATLLQSTTLVFSGGVYGAMAYAAGSITDVTAFVILAVEQKRIAPGSHTILEIIKRRYGTWAHCVFMFYAWATNILVTAMLLTGASQTINALCGMNIIASIFLIPSSVYFATIISGLRSTLLLDSLHTTILLILILVFGFYTFTADKNIGSIDRLWELLTDLAKNHPVEGNQDGSLLTYHSHTSGVNQGITVCANFGPVLLDVAMHLKAAAAQPSAIIPGFIGGQISWFAIPFFLATFLGLSGAVLQYTPSWPTWPNPLSEEQTTAGLALPYTMVALLGKNGGSAALLMIFMAVLSSSSAEFVAASTIWTYDIYKTYINPRATSRQLLIHTQVSMSIFVLIMIAFSIGLYYGNIGMGWLFDFVGTLLGAAVIPMFFIVFWTKLNVWAATIAPILGTCSGIGAWLGSSSAMNNHVINTTTTAATLNNVIGNATSLLSPLLFMLILQLAFGPQKNFSFDDLKDLKSIHAVNEDELHAYEEENSDKEKEGTFKDTAEVEVLQAREEEYNKDFKVMLKHRPYAWGAYIFLALAFMVIFSMPLYGTRYVFSKPFFRGYIIVGFIWTFCTLFYMSLFVIWQGRDSTWTLLRGFWWDITGKSHKLKQFQQDHPEEMHQGVMPEREISSRNSSE